MEMQHPEYPHASKIGQRIRTLRGHQGMTTTELGRLTGFSQQQISAIERGKVNTPIESLAAMAEKLGTKLEILLTDEAFAALHAHPPRDWHTLATELAQACMEAPKGRIPLALALFAAELQHGMARGQQEDDSCRE